MKVEALMVESVRACKSGDSLAQAARIMWEHDCGCVPVVDDEQQVVGMLTDRDVCMAAYTQGARLHEIPISSAMSRKVRSCRRDEDVEVVLDRMCSDQVRRLPVVDERKRLIGIVSLNDIAVEAANERALKRKQVTLEQVARTLATVCAHRQNSGELIVEFKPQSKLVAAKV